MTWDEIRYDGTVVRDEPQRIKLSPKLEDIRAADDGRRLKRIEIKRQGAAAELAEVRHGELKQAIAQVEADIDALASEHVGMCAPLQADLKQLEEKQISAIVAREPADPELESKRRGILDQLKALNSSLDTATEAKQKLLDRLEGERLEVARQTAGNLFEANLLRTGEPGLLAKLFVSQKAERWAESRYRAALEVVDSHRRDNTPPNPMSARNWAAELAAAAAAFELAKVAQEAAYQNVINE